MFTGLIEEQGKVLSFQKGVQGAVLTVSCDKILQDIKLGSSVSVNGACLTVTSFSSGQIEVQVSNETLLVSNFSKIGVGEAVNLERAMQLSSRLDGHLVSGHLDGVAKFIKKESDGFSFKFFFELNNELSRYVIKKGSITINGISLTVATVLDNVVSVEVIPHTLSETNLGNLKNGDFVNIETDLIAKYVEKFSRLGDNTTKITASFLQENGFL